MRARRWVLPIAAPLLMAGAAAARDTDPVTAEVLFQEARQLLEQGRLDDACPKFIESERLDPATATLLAVATCHERQGHLATAWAEFMEAAGRAQREGRKDREKLARERVRALESRLSTLTVVVPPDLAAIEGLSIRRDGVEIGPTVHNRALPIDGGEHWIALGAPGYISKLVPVTVAAERDRQTLTLPMLERAPERAETEPFAGAALPAPKPAEAVRPRPGLSGMQVLGVGLGTAGIAAASVGAGFLAAALVKKDQSDAHCDDRDVCNANGLTLREEAVHRGNVATALGIGGALVAATGLTLYWAGARSAEQRARGEMSLAVHAGANAVAADLQVGF